MDEIDRLNSLIDKVIMYLRSNHDVDPYRTRQARELATELHEIRVPCPNCYRLFIPGDRRKLYCSDRCKWHKAYERGLPKKFSTEREKKAAKGAGGR